MDYRSDIVMRPKQASYWPKLVSRRRRRRRRRMPRSCNVEWRVSRWGMFNLEGMWEEVTVATSRYYLSIRLRKMRNPRKVMKNIIITSAEIRTRFLLNGSSALMTKFFIVFLPHLFTLHNLNGWSKRDKTMARYLVSSPPPPVRPHGVVLS